MHNEPASEVTSLQTLLMRTKPVQEIGAHPGIRKYAFPLTSVLTLRVVTEYKTSQPTTGSLKRHYFTRQVVGLRASDMFYPHGSQLLYRLPSFMRHGFPLADT